MVPKVLMIFAVAQIPLLQTLEGRSMGKSLELLVHCPTEIPQTHQVSTLVVTSNSLA